MLGTVKGVGRRFGFYLHAKSNRRASRGTSSARSRKERSEQGLLYKGAGTEPRQWRRLLLLGGGGGGGGCGGGGDGVGGATCLGGPSRPATAFLVWRRRVGGAGASTSRSMSGACGYHRLGFRFLPFMQWLRISQRSAVLGLPRWSAMTKAKCRGSICQEMRGRAL